LPAGGAVNVVNQNASYGMIMAAQPITPLSIKDALRRVAAFLDKRLTL
jgi:hypothetical protein